MAYHALVTPEIVERIIQLAERFEISACMYVCKLWSEFALDRKWERINWDRFMDSLFTILFPELREHIDDVRSTSKLPAELSDDSYWKTQGDWNRFRYYANRIKYLSFTDRKMDYEVMAVLARTCPHPHIFPRLYHFTANMESDINGSITYAAKYFCETLRSLFLIFPDLTTTRSDSSIPSIGGRLNVPTFVQDAVRRSPNIVNLMIFVHGVFGADEMESGIVFLLSNLQRLEKVHITGEDLSPRVLVPLALLPQLKDLHIHIGSYQMASESIKDPFPPASNDNTHFPTLTDLYISASPDITNALLRSFSGFEKLRVLKLSQTWSTEQQWEVLLSKISTCSNLVEVSFWALAFSANTLSPLRRLNQLASLYLLYFDESTLTDMELLDFVKSFPRLTILHLSPTTGYRSFHAHKSSLTLNLLTLLSHQPNQLRTLRLHIHNGPDVGLNTDIGVHLKGLTRLRLVPMGRPDPSAFVASVSDVVKRCLSEECMRDFARSDLYW